MDLALRMYIRRLGGGHDHDHDHNHDHNEKSPTSPNEKDSHDHDHDHGHGHGHGHIHSNFLLEEWEIFAVAVFISYLITFIFNACLLFYLWRNKKAATAGGTEAAKKIIIPSLEPYMWICLFISFCFCIFSFYHLVEDPDIIYHFVNMHSTAFSTFTVEALQAGRVLISSSVIFLMLQYQITTKAMLRSIGWSSILVLILVVAAAASAGLSNDGSSDVQIHVVEIVVSKLALSLGYLVVYLYLPKPHLHEDGKRYVLFLLLQLALDILWPTLMQMKFYQIGAAISYVSAATWAFSPILIWKYFRAETEYWRFVAAKSCRFIEPNHSKHISNLPFILPNNENDAHVIVQDLYNGNYGHVIDFSYLTLQKVIGYGATAKVYEGTLFNEFKVAIKVNSISIEQCIEESTMTFAQEASILTRLSHPNIVEIHGICVSPPHLYLISELCQSNLVDCIYNMMETRAETLDVMLHITLSMVLDAARAIAYLHELRPVLLHRDIKSRNFLLDSYGNVKLSDFGESCQYGYNTIPENLRNSMNTKLLSIHGTVEYLAPEIITGKHGYAEYERPADIYSLAITMREITHLCVEETPSNSLLLMEQVVQGWRPHLSPCLPEKLTNLISRAWCSDPLQRPTAQVIVEELEQIQYDLHRELAPRLLENWNVETEKGETTISSGHFQGNYAVNLWKQIQIIPNDMMGIRLGNALMDTGYLHHVAHKVDFQISNQKLYVFSDLTKDFHVKHMDYCTSCNCSEFYKQVSKVSPLHPDKHRVTVENCNKNNNYIPIYSLQ